MRLEEILVRFFLDRKATNSSLVLERKWHVRSVYESVVTSQSRQIPQHSLSSFLGPSFLTESHSGQLTYSRLMLLEW